MNTDKLFKVTAKIEFTHAEREITHFVHAENEDEAIQKTDYWLAETYGDEMEDGEFLDCELIA
jgi:hypothetical protein